MGLEHGKEGVKRAGAIANREDGNLAFPMGWKHDNKPVRVQPIIHCVVAARKQTPLRYYQGRVVFCEFFSRALLSPER